MVDKVHVSKTMCSFLRHNPEEVGGLDSEGFTSLESLVKALDKARDEYEITEEVVREIVEEDNKDRYEIVGDKIRATHGHSSGLDVSINRESQDSSIPEFLYHGTPREKVDSIMNEGLKPMSRKTVHLTDDEREARETGKRHSDNVAVLKIETKELESAGYDIVDTDGGIYIVDGKIPSKFINVKF